MRQFTIYLNEIECEYLQNCLDYAIFWTKDKKRKEVLSSINNYINKQKLKVAHDTNKCKLI